MSHPVDVCVCVCVRERERERERTLATKCGQQACTQLPQPLEGPTRTPIWSVRPANGPEKIHMYR